jgi:hypothetical protein
MAVNKNFSRHFDADLPESRARLPALIQTGRHVERASARAAALMGRNGSNTIGHAS